MGGEFLVNTYTVFGQSNPAVAADADGAFVVVWQSDGPGPAYGVNEVQGQRYASDGSPIGAEFQVNTYTTGDQSSPAVATEDGGAFVIVWQGIG